MQVDLIKELRDQLLGRRISKKLISQITTRRPQQTLYQYQAVIDAEPKQKERLLYEMVMLLMYHNYFEQLHTLRQMSLLTLESFVQLAELAVDFALKQKAYEKAYGIADHIALDTMRMRKCITKYLDVLLRADKFEQAGAIWQRHNDLEKLKESMVPLFDKIFASKMRFQKPPKQRDYTQAIELQTIFSLPAEITYQRALHQFEMQIEAENFGKAATLGRVFKLGETRTIDAAYRAWKEEMQIFCKRLEQGKYKHFRNVKKTDPYMRALSIRDEFQFYTQPMDTGTISFSRINDVQRYVQIVLKKLLTDDTFETSSPYAGIFFANRLLHDYHMISEETDPDHAKENCGFCNRLFVCAVEQITDIKSARRYVPILQELSELSVIDMNLFFAEFQTILSYACDSNEMTFARHVADVLDISDDTIIDVLTPHVLSYLHAMNIDAIQGLIDSLQITPEQLYSREQIQHEVEQVYAESLIEGKYLKCLALVDVFSMEMPKKMIPVTYLIKDLILASDKEAVYRLFQKYHVRRYELQLYIKHIYLDLIAIDKQYAKTFRSYLYLSVFEVGFFNWLFYEVFNFLPTDTHKESKVRRISTSSPDKVSVKQ